MTKLEKYFMDNKAQCDVYNLPHFDQAVCLQRHDDGSPDVFIIEEGVYFDDLDKLRKQVAWLNEMLQEVTPPKEGE